MQKNLYGLEQLYFIFLVLSYSISYYELIFYTNKTQIY